MKMLALSALIAISSIAVAHELDNVQPVSQQQIEKAKEIPGTIVIRRAKNNPQEVAVVHLKDKVKPGTKLTSLQFEKMALNAEKTGIAYDSKNELDARSSTSSWSFGIYYNPGYNYYRPSYYSNSYRYGAGYGSGYGYSNNYYGRSAYYSYYQPSYNYSGYRYNYQAYYSYSDRYYNYDYCSWYY